MEVRICHKDGIYSDSDCLQKCSDYEGRSLHICDVYPLFCTVTSVIVSSLKCKWNIFPKITGKKYRQVWVGKPLCRLHVACPWGGWIRSCSGRVSYERGCCAGRQVPAVAGCSACVPSWGPWQPETPPCPLVRPCSRSVSWWIETGLQLAGILC